MLASVKNNYLFVKKQSSFFHAILARAKKLNGKKWFVFNKHEVLFFSINA
jgi:hypothetical protein